MGWEPDLPHHLKTVVAEWNTRPETGNHALIMQVSARSAVK
jgi:hypothetical protein